MTTTSNAEAGRDTLVERLFGSALGALDLFCIYLGDQLGMYRALVDEGPSTSTELASLVGVNERYTREWLQQQAMAGILETRNPTASAGYADVQVAPIENDFWRFYLLTP